MQENSRLRTQEQQHQWDLAGALNGPSAHSDQDLMAGSRSPRSAIRPVSMFEPRDQQKIQPVSQDKVKQQLPAAL